MPGVPLRNKKQEVVAHAQVDVDDHEKVSLFRWHLDSKGYARTSFIFAGQRKFLWMHRLILGDKTGAVIDHRNRDRLDNRRENLRHSTRSQNAANKMVVTAKTSAYKGVTVSRKKSGKLRFRAYLMKEGGIVFNGLFSTEIDAAVAYDQAALLHFGEFAATNFPDSASKLTPTPVAKSQRASHSKYGYRGVYKDRNRFGVQIYDPRLKKLRRLARFDTIEAAARAFDQAALELYGQQAVLNFPEEI